MSKLQKIADEMFAAAKDGQFGRAHILTMEAVEEMRPAPITWQGDEARRWAQLGNAMGEIIAVAGGKYEGIDCSAHFKFSVWRSGENLKYESGECWHYEAARAAAEAVMRELNKEEQC